MYELLNETSVISGSYVWSKLTGKPYNDIDIYTNSNLTLTQAQFIYTSNHYGLKVDNYIYQNNKVQVIHVECDPILYIKETFDMNFLKNYMNNSGTIYTLHNQDLLIEEINITNYSKIYQERIVKYKERGVKFLNKGKTVDELKPDKETRNYWIDQYKRLGYIVIPLSDRQSGKVPLLKNWTNTTLLLDNKSLNSTNIGLLVGKESNLICIDVDHCDNGVEVFDKLIEKYKLPDCPIQVTPNGGRHYLFQYTEELSGFSSIKGVIKNNEKIGIDIFTEKRQFVVCPSINLITGNEYKWSNSLITTAPPAIPRWLIYLIKNKHINNDYEIIGYNDTYLNSFLSYFK